MRSLSAVYITVQGAGHGVDTVHTTHAFGVVDEEALAEAIRNSQIRGAAEDGEKLGTALAKQLKSDCEGR